MAFNKTRPDWVIRYVAVGEVDIREDMITSISFSIYGRVSDQMKLLHGDEKNKKETLCKKIIKSIPIVFESYTENYLSVWCDLKSVSLWSLFY